MDLNPLDVHDEDATAWLTMLVWPEQEDRRKRLVRAIEIAREDPPTIVRGDLFDELPALLHEAGACRWVSNEAAAVLPRVTGALCVPPGRFVLGLDARPVALTHGHGHAIDGL